MSKEKSQVIAWLMACFIGLIALTSCATVDNTSNQEVGTAETSQTEPAQTEASQGEAYVYEKLDISLDSMECFSLADEQIQCLGVVYSDSDSNARSFYACEIGAGGSTINTMIYLMDGTSSCYVYDLAWSDGLLAYLVYENMEDSAESRIVLQDVSGETLFSIDEKGLLEGYEQSPNLSDIAITSDGDILLLTLQNLYWIDQTGTVQAQVDVSERSYDLGTLSDGTVYLYDYYNQDGPYTVDTPGTLTLTATLFPTAAYNRLYGVLAGSGEYAYYYVEEDQLYGLDTTGEDRTELLDLSVFTDVAYLWMSDSGAWMVVCQDALSDGYQLYSAQLTQDGNQTEAEILTIAVSEDDILPSPITALIKEYNLTHVDYQIVVQTYTDADLQSAVLYGTAPDIIYFDMYCTWEKMNASICEVRGFLEDLTPYFEQDTTVDISDLIPSVAAALENNGQMFQIAYGFLFSTAYCDAQYGATENWSLEEFCDIAETLPDEMWILDGTSSDTLLTLLSFCLDEFVDRDNDTCYFESSLFYRLLEVCKTHQPVEYPLTGSYDEFLTIKNDSRGLTGVISIMEQYEDEIIFTGMPGGGSSLTFAGTFAIPVTAPHSDAAWEFLSSLLTQEAQSSTHLTQMYNPVNQAAFESYLDMDSTSGQAAAALVYSATTATDYTDPVLSIIEEETLSYFYGDKTAEAVANIIQDRVSTYLAEQS